MGSMRVMALPCRVGIMIVCILGVNKLKYSAAVLPTYFRI